MQCVQSGLGAASRVSDGSFSCFPALLNALSASVSRRVTEQADQCKRLISYARPGVPRLNSPRSKPPAVDHKAPIHAKAQRNLEAQQEHAVPHDGPGVQQPVGDVGKLRWLQPEALVGPESSDTQRRTVLPRSRPSSGGASRWLPPQQGAPPEQVQRRPLPRPAPKPPANNWRHNNSGPLNGASQHLNRGIGQRPPLRRAPQPPLDRAHPWADSGAGRVAQQQREQDRHHWEERQSGSQRAKNGAPPRYHGPQRVLRQPAQPRTRWLAALKPDVGADTAPASAAAAPAAVEELEAEPVADRGADEEQGGTAAHRWIPHADALRESRSHQPQLAAGLWDTVAPATPAPKPKKDWSAYAPPRDTMAAIQEEQQKRYHRVKVRKQLEMQQQQGNWEPQLQDNRQQQQQVRDIRHQQQQQLSLDPMPPPMANSSAARGPMTRAQQRKEPPPLQKPKPPEEIVLPEEVTVAQLASLLNCGLEKLEETLEGLGEKPASYEDRVEVDIAELAALELGKLAIRSPDAQDRDRDAVPRPPVVTVMGHVDHGKTSLLDALRKTAVAAGEAGGITQHIGAFEVSLPGSQATATFLDTPGHAAFTAMRARGASITDIVILVVAANDGVMPQTEEALAHARAAGCPIVVALTKCDMPGAEPERVKNQLLSLGLQLEEAGGNVMVVETAAPKGVGLAELEEAVLLQAEIMDLRATADGRAEGAVVEARRDKGQGPVATVIVKRGRLQVGDYVVVGTEWGRVRSMRSAAGNAVRQALPGQPVEVTGLRGVPQAGDELMVLPSDERARRVGEARSQRAEDYRHSRQSHAVRAQLAARQAAAEAADGGAAPPEQQTSHIDLIIKADVQGSAEAVRDSVQLLASDMVGVKVIHVGVGPVTAFDVDMASSVGACIVAFNVKTADATTDALAKSKAVDVMQHRVIYRLLEEVGERMAGAAPRVEQEKVVGEAQVLQVFEVPDKRAGVSHSVAGCRITDGSLRAAARFRVLRAGTLVHEGACASLKRHKLDVERVGKGMECGVLLEGFDGVQQGDVLHCIEVEMVQAAKEAVLGNTSLENKA